MLLGRIAIVAAAAFAVVPFIVPAAAESDGVRFIDLKSATSACIGKNETPICAAETLLACMVRAAATACASIGVAEERLAAFVAPTRLEYTVERISVIRPEDVTEDLRDLDWFRPGYTMIELQRRACPAGSASCADENWAYFQIFARPRAAESGPSRWEIVTWRGDTEPDQPPEIPESFRRDQPGN
ncbi:MAG: hypothetical protein HY057_14880 [Rhodospirillales bacterium]|nr:hypothetical protein [Rhodospirillales bacterium]